MKSVGPAILLFLAACSGRESLPSDLGVADTGNSPADQGTLDSGQGDTGSNADTGQTAMDAQAPDDGGVADTGSAMDASSPADTGTGTVADPFAPQPDTSEGLTNVSADLNALLENGALEGACAAYEANPTDRRLKLMCGKWMFFYETYDTGGVPAPLIDFMIEAFPQRSGTRLRTDGHGARPQLSRNAAFGFGTRRALWKH